MDPASIAIGAAVGLLRSARSANAAANDGVIARMLGPWADSFGKDLATRREERRARNIGRILTAADGIGGDGSPNSRVLGEVLEQGSWCESEIASRYLAGVLAGSRSSTGEDDSGLPWARLLGGLSGSELALHYVVYATIRDADPERHHNLSNGQVASSTIIHLPAQYWTHVTGYGGDTSSTVIGLQRVGLLGEALLCRPDGEMYLTASIAGIELFARGHGIARPDYEMFQIEARAPHLGELLDEVMVGYDGPPATASWTTSWSTVTSRFAQSQA